MGQREIDAAARKVLLDLERRGEAPLMALQEAWAEEASSFYMGLGALILRRRVLLEERQGTIWVTPANRGREPEAQRFSAGLRTAAALRPLCREGFGPEAQLSICTTCPSLLDACPSGGVARLILAA